MKKALSILLSVLMIMSCFAFAISAEERVFAGECECTDHKPASTGEKCHCCIFCNNLENSYVTSCVKRNDDGTVTVCCHYCDGIYPCDCDCECCPKDYDASQDATKPILTPEQQDKVVSTFQRIMSQFVEWFDNFFNTIFEFLRLDEILGTNK